MPSGQRYHYGVHQERRELYFTIFKINTDARYYAKVRNLIQELGGSMEWKRGGAGGGGTWTIELHGRNHRVPVRGLDTNDLDRLYLPEVDEPRTSLDYGSPGKLQPDVFWRLVELFRAERKSDAPDGRPLFTQRLRRWILRNSTTKGPAFQKRATISRMFACSPIKGRTRRSTPQSEE